MQDTLREANAACNEMAATAFEKGVLARFKLHKLCYHGIRSGYHRSAQRVIRAIAKVADAYKKDQQTKRSFKPLGQNAPIGR